MHQICTYLVLPQGQLHKGLQPAELTIVGKEVYKMNTLKLGLLHSTFSFDSPPREGATESAPNLGSFR